MAQGGNHARSFSKGARGPLGVQDHKFGRLSRYFESEGLDDFGSLAWFDDSKVQLCIILCGNRNTIPISLRRLEGSFRPQPGLAAMCPPYNMAVPPPVGYVALANVAELDSRHGRAIPKSFELNFEMFASLGEARGGRGDELSSGVLDRR